MEPERDFNYFFRQDMLKLFDTYNKKNTFRYSDFVEIWNEMKLYHIIGLVKLFFGLKKNKNAN